MRAIHEAPRDYDAGYDSRTGTRVAGRNSLDAHGPLRTAPAGTPVPYGCGNQMCHIQFYHEAGLSGSYPANSCSTCHGPNILTLPPYDGTYMWDSRAAS